MTERLTIGISADFKTDAAGRLRSWPNSSTAAHVVYDYFATSGSGPDGPLCPPRRHRSLRRRASPRRPLHRRLVQRRRPPRRHRPLGRRL